jgi:hypothetical protein
MAKLNTKKRVNVKTKNPILGSGILANSISRSQIGKLDCSGIITIFWAWAFPCIRHWQALATIFNLKKGKTPITVSIGKRNSIKLSSLLMMDIEVKDNLSTITVPIMLNYKFCELGLYNLVISFKDYPDKLKIPFEVREKKWPIITNDEKRFIKEQKGFFPKFQANVHCEKCKHVYVFEESIGAIKSGKGGVFSFPENGVFECVECGTTLQLKDLQGQLRSALKDTILKQMGRK